MVLLGQRLFVLFAFFVSTPLIDSAWADTCFSVRTFGFTGDPAPDKVSADASCNKKAAQFCQDLLHEELAGTAQQQILKVPCPDKSKEICYQVTCYAYCRKANSCPAHENRTGPNPEEEFWSLVTE